MKYFSMAILFLAAVMLPASDLIPPINISGISFRDATWDNAYNIFYSKQRISDLTANNKAVVLYFFDACFS